MIEKLAFLQSDPCLAASSGERGSKPRRRRGIPGLHGAERRKMGETAGEACGERGPRASLPAKANKGVQGGSTEMPASGTKSVRCWRKFVALRPV